MNRPRRLGVPGLRGLRAASGQDGKPPRTYRDGKLSYKVNLHLVVYPEALASFQPTGRTSTKAVLICQPQAASTCCTAHTGIAGASSA